MQVAYSYPREPPPCLQPETRGTRCADCPYAECGNLAVGQQMVRLESELEDERIRHTESLKDKIIPRFLLGGGVERRIDMNPELAGEIAEGAWALVIGDIRGLKDVNDTIGIPAGDNLLYAAGDRMFQARHRVGRRDPERRAAPDITDIGFRGINSDELGIIVRKVTPEQATEVLHRTIGRFSISGALQDDQAGELPIIGTFLSVHASNIRAHVGTETRVSYTARNLFYAVLGAGLQELHTLKAAQYEAMWGRICEYYVNQSKPAPEKPHDQRGIATLFRTMCLPNYHQNQEMLLRNAGPHMLDV